MRALGWAWYALVQLIMLTATIAGWLLLILPCLCRAWRLSARPSINDGRVIDEWSWPLIGRVYGNPEDGVSGQTALIWSATGRIAYMPGAWAPWRAYCWSALRNSSDALKYAFAWRGSNPPWVAGTFRAFGRQWHYGLGWQTENSFYCVPVLSVKPA